jgi:hypothetical protein
MPMHVFVEGQDALSWDVLVDETRRTCRQSLTDGIVGPSWRSFTRGFEYRCQRDSGAIPSLSARP